MANSNEYMRVYILERYHRRRSKALVLLGNKCVRCDRTNDLQFDHVDPKTKIGTVAKIWSYSEKRFWAEVAKCQLLCQEHHIEKTLNELGLQSARNTHGTLSALRYCTPRCNLCKEAAAKYGRERKKAIREGTYVSKHDKPT